jgi:hypothetical protein
VAAAASVFSGFPAAAAAALFCGGGGFLPETDKSLVIWIFEAQLYFLTHFSPF